MNQEKSQINRVAGTRSKKPEEATLRKMEDQPLGLLKGNSGAKQSQCLSNAYSSSTIFQSPGEGKNCSKKPRRFQGRARFSEGKGKTTKKS